MCIGSPIQTWELQPKGMARHKLQERHRLMLPVALSDQIKLGSFAFALKFLVGVARRLAGEV